MQRSSSDTRDSRVQHSVRALAHSVSPSAWHDVVEMRRADPTVAIAIRVGLATLIALVGGGLLGYSEVAGFAALGSLCCAFLRHEPYPRMAGKLACIGACVVAYTFAGAVLGALGLSIWLQIAVLSVAAGLAYLFLSAFRMTGPGPVILIFAAAGAAGFAHTGSDVRIATAAAAMGALVGWIVALLPALWNPHGPARVAVARALAATAALETEGEAAVSAARAAATRAREVIALGSRRDSHTAELLALVGAAEAVIDSGPHDTFAGRRADFVRFEAELRKTRPTIDIPREDISAVPDLERPRGFVREGALLLRDRALFIGACRVLAASALAGGFAAVVGLEHPLWATMGAMAALQGVNYRHTVARAIQRLLGNVVGALIAAAVLVLDLGYWPVVAVIVLLQTITELFVTRNYAVASIFVTAMALLLTGIGEPLGADIALSRVGDTLIGVVVGVVVAAVTIHRDDRHHLTS